MNAENILLAILQQVKGGKEFISNGGLERTWMRYPVNNNSV